MPHIKPEHVQTGATPKSDIRKRIERLEKDSHPYVETVAYDVYVRDINALLNSVNELTVRVCELEELLSSCGLKKPPENS